MDVCLDADTPIIYQQINVHCNTKTVERNYNLIGYIEYHLLLRVCNMNDGVSKHELKNASLLLVNVL